MNKARRMMVQSLMQILTLIDTQLDSVSYAGKENFKKLRDARKLISDARGLMSEWLNDTLDEE